jgi:hypothetical protein
MGKHPIVASQRLAAAFPPVTYSHAAVVLERVAYLFAAGSYASLEAVLHIYPHLACARFVSPIVCKAQGLCAPKLSPKPRSGASP